MGTTKGKAQGEAAFLQNAWIRIRFTWNKAFFYVFFPLKHPYHVTFTSLKLQTKFTMSPPPPTTTTQSDLSRHHLFSVIVFALRLCLSTGELSVSTKLCNSNVLQTFGSRRRDFCEVKGVKEWWGSERIHSGSLPGLVLRLFCLGSEPLTQKKNWFELEGNTHEFEVTSELTDI